MNIITSILKSNYFGARAKRFRYKGIAYNLWGFFGALRSYLNAARLWLKRCAFAANDLSARFVLNSPTNLQRDKSVGHSDTHISRRPQAVVVRLGISIRGGERVER